MLFTSQIDFISHFCFDDAEQHLIDQKKEPNIVPSICQVYAKISCLSMPRLLAAIILYDAQSSPYAIILHKLNMFCLILYSQSSPYYIFADIPICFLFYSSSNFRISECISFQLYDSFTYLNPYVN